MPTYRFSAKNQNGAEIGGKVVEKDPDRALERLQRNHPSLSEVSLQRDYGACFLELQNHLQPVSRTEVATFFRQLALMFASGVELSRAVQLLGDTHDNGRLRETLLEIDRGLHAGQQLSAMLKRFPQIFPPEICGLVSVGEATGSMEEVLEFAAQLLEDDDLRTRRVKSAMTYPSVVLLIAIAMSVALIFFFVPRLGEVLQMMPGEMSLPLRLLLALSDFLSRPLLVLSLSLAGLLALLESWLWSRTESGRRWWDKFLLGLPLTRPLILELCICRLSFGLHLMTRCGLGLVEALTLIARGLPSAEVGRAVLRVRSSVVDGGTLAESFESEPALSGAILVQMTRVGEEASSLEAMMKNVHDFYHDQLESRLDTLTALIEPVIMVGMGIVVGGMVLTFMLPLVRLVQTL